MRGRGLAKAKKGAKKEAEVEAKAAEGWLAEEEEDAKETVRERALAAVTPASEATAAELGGFEYPDPDTCVAPAPASSGFYLNPALRPDNPRKPKVAPRRRKLGEEEEGEGKGEEEGPAKKKSHRNQGGLAVGQQKSTKIGLMLSEGAVGLHEYNYCYCERGFSLALHRFHL